MENPITMLIYVNPDRYKGARTVADFMPTA